MYNESVGWRLYLVSVVSPVFDEMRQALGKLTMKHKIHILALAAAVAVSAQSAFAENLVIATNNGDMVRMQLTDDFSAKHPDIELERITAEEQYANDITEVALGDGLTAGELTPSPLFQTITNFQLSEPENYSWGNCRRTVATNCLCDVSGYKNVLFVSNVCSTDSYLRKKYSFFKERQNEYLRRIKAYLVTLEDVLKTAQIAESDLLNFYKTPAKDVNCDETKEYLNKKLGDLDNAVLHFKKESAKAFNAAEVKFVFCLNALGSLNSLIKRDMITYASSVKKVEKREGVSVDTTSLLLHFNRDNNPYPNRQRCPVRDIQFSKEQISNVRKEIKGRYDNVKQEHNKWLQGNSCGWTKDMTY